MLWVPLDCDSEQGQGLLPKEQSSRALWNKRPQVLAAHPVEFGIPFLCPIFSLGPGTLGLHQPRGVPCTLSLNNWSLVAQGVKGGSV